ncbi:hypothetical protein FA15DRAFT_663995 [Coprinopsis marcescibilis]|uniref:F-box domain-containing protein n=1 Tax=Coprinopsis marcescibilis TaxID=230819 RepID=A0A5C3L8W0_COPMA|nr:hypothetical protein FA15DRAFT_663995 [Coprinopsis marcescibilis]
MPSTLHMPLRLKTKTSSIRSYLRIDSPKLVRHAEDCLIDKLPIHVVNEIGQRIESLVDLVNLSLCSRRMRSLLAPSLYSQVELKSNKQCKSTLVLLSKRPEYARYVRRLRVCPNSVEWTAPGEEIDEGLVANLICSIVPQLRSLEYFAWDGWEQPSENLWAALRKSCSQLRGVSSVIGDQPLNPSSQLFAFSNLSQFSITVKTKSLEWLAAGPPKAERLPRRLWEMLIERCPRLEELSFAAVAPAHRMFDIRNILLGRWPRLRSLTLGDTILQGTSKDDAAVIQDLQNFNRFFILHSKLQHIACQHAGGSTTFPSSFSLPFSALPRLESFHGPLKYLRTLPHPEKLRHLTLTSLHHTMTSFQPTFTALQDFPNLETMHVWVDLSFGGQLYLQDESHLFNTFLTACPVLRHLQLMCFSRPTFRLRDFSRALRSAPNLESFTLIKMYKSSDEDMTSSAVRILQENPHIEKFTLKYTQDRWPTMSNGRLKQMGVYRSICDEFGYPESVQGSEWKLKSFGTVSSRTFNHSLAAKLSFSPGWEARSPRSSFSSDSRSWHRRTGSQSSFVMVAP